jgi:crotonobetainyl-CoA:carnitine CoA-transferase CaiB-like acyl-CoA transferase
MTPPIERRGAAVDPPGGAKAALAGIRILDLTRLGYGAQCTAVLGALGAEVIRVESRTRPDPLRLMPPYVPTGGENAEAGPQTITAETAFAHGFNRGGIFYKYNFGGKRSVTLNLKDPRGLDLLRRLVPLCDVLTESFAAGTLARMGLAYDELRRLRPDLVYVSMSGFGHSGRDHRHVTLGPTAQALTGLTYMVGLPGRRSAGWSYSYLDHMGGYLGAFGVLCALRHRARTGEGQHIDVSQIEPGIPLAGPLVLDRAVNGRRYRRSDTPTSNRSSAPPMAPHGIYRCQGADAWIAIAVRDDADWARLRRAMGDPPWARERRLETLAGRRDAAVEIDGYLEAWTSTQERYALMEKLLGVGVPAGAVQDAEDRVECDRQLRARDYFVRLANGETGEWPSETPPFRLSGTPAHAGGSIRRGPPCIGEDNEYVLGTLLGMTADQMASMAEEGILV